MGGAGGLGVLCGVDDLPDFLRADRRLAAATGTHPRQSVETFGLEAFAPMLDRCFLMTGRSSLHSPTREKPEKVAMSRRWTEVSGFVRGARPASRQPPAAFALHRTEVPKEWVAGDDLCGQSGTGQLLH